MKKMMIAGAAAAVLAAPVYAELEGELSLTYQNQYDYRGVNELMPQFLVGVDDAIAAEFNASYSLNDQWSLVAGATLATVSDGLSLDHNRYRAGVRYTTACYTVELGYQSQDLNIGGVFGAWGLDTAEIYLNASTKCPLTGGTLNLFAAYDIDMLEGTYVELSLKKGFEINETVSVDLTVGVSYSFDYWENLLGDTGNDFNHAYLTVGLPVAATENLTVTPYVSYSQGFGALDFGGGVEEGDEFSFGVKAAVKF